MAFNLFKFKFIYLKIIIFIDLTLFFMQFLNFKKHFHKELFLEKINSFYNGARKLMFRRVLNLHRVLSFSSGKSFGNN